MTEPSLSNLESSSIDRESHAPTVTEQSLRERDQIWQKLSEQIPGVIYQYRLYPDGRSCFPYASEGIRRIYGVTPEEVKESADSVFAILHPEDLAYVAETIEQSATSLILWQAQYRVILTNEEIHWLEGQAMPERLADGSILWHGYIRDITVLKQVQAALGDSENRLQSFLRHLPACAYIKDLSRRHLFVNQTLLDLINQPLDYVVGKTDQELYSEEMVKCCSANDDLVIQSGIAHQFEESFSDIHFGDNNVHSFLSIKFPLRDSRNQIYGIGGISTDITNLKKTEAKLRQSQEQISQILSSIRDGVLSLDRQWCFTYLNHQAEVLLQRTQAELLGQNIWQKFPETLHFKFHEQSQRAMVEQVSLSCQEFHATLNIWLEFHIYPFDEGLTVYVQDISDRKNSELALQNSEERYRLLAENINDLIGLHDFDGTYSYISPSCEALLGYRPEELLGQDLYQWVHPDDRDRVREEAYRLASQGVTQPVTYRIRHRSGEYLWLETLTKPIFDDQGQVVQLQTTSRNVSERVRVQELLRHDAMYDTLTRLPNRNHLIERLTLALNRARRSNVYNFGILFFDLDRFKVINDSLGHFVGDQVLAAVAQTFQSLLRSTDLAARLGGDEFVILVEEVHDIKEVICIIERIFSELHIPIHIDNRDIFITASVGVVLAGQSYSSSMELLRDADIAMYRAKGKGKARYEVFDAEMHAAAIQRLNLENDLRQAIDHEQFIVYYQPIIETECQMLAGFEALVRWQHPERGLVAPGEFMAIAEETGLVVPLDRWVLKTACQQLAQWKIRFPQLSDLKVSVNLSSLDLWDDHLIDEVDEILRETGLEASKLALEITESMLVEDVEATISLLNKLKAKGVQMSIDDFGTGYSSLNYLYQFPVDYLKIDRSFINRMEDGQRNYKIVQTIISLSEQLGIKSIAEGIETQEQFEHLQHLGCAFAQGYLFSRPLSAQCLEELFIRESLAAAESQGLVE